MNIKKYIFVLLLPYLNLYCQTDVPIDNDILRDIDRQLVEQNTCPAFEKPYTVWQINEINLPPVLQHVYKKNTNWLYRKLRFEHFYTTDTGIFKISIDPVINLQLSKQTTGKYFYNNTRGLRLISKVGNNFGFTSSFYENQSTLPEPVSSFARQYRVVPGMGKMRVNNNVFDYAWAEATFGFKISKHFAVTAGNGKLFMGHGYRSLMLSDISFGYPYIRLMFASKYWQYSVIRARLSDFGNNISYFSNDYYQAFNHKTAAFQTITFAPIKSIQILLFEGYLIKASQTNLSILNPIIYSNSTFNNVLRGISFNSVTFKQLLVYSQLVNYNNNIAWQAGTRWFAWGNLYFVTEYNSVGKNMYNSTDSVTRYINYNQNLASAYGNNFNETVLIANWGFKNLNINYRAGFVKFGNTYNQLIIYNWLKTYNNLFSSTYVNAKQLQKHDICLSYIINKAMHFRVELGYSIRKFEGINGFNSQQFIYLALKTSIGNYYNDY